MEEGDSFGCKVHLTWNNILFSPKTLLWAFALKAQAQQVGRLSGKLGTIGNILIQTPLKTV